jgi:cyclopropane-fatty-acyl-phospholipid synthase
METWLVKHYIHSPIHIPEAPLQGLLNQWVRWSHLWDDWRQPRIDDTPKAIAERSRELVATHYNLPLGLFEQTLGATMKYSMALWEKGAASLDDAQNAMMADLCQKVDIQDGDRVLDIGCGFGSFAAYVLQNFPNCQVYGLNLSRMQCDYIQEKSQESGHSLNTDRFHLIEQDFNDFDSEIKFDRIISIGFFEHVSDLEGALRKVYQLLEPNGVSLIHYIVCRALPDRYSSKIKSGFIEDYIFPGGHIHSYDKIFRFQKDLMIDQHWFLNGINYQRTLEAWLANFKANRDAIKHEVGLSEETLKVWDIYLRGCIAVFQIRNGEYYGNGQFRLVHHQH